MTLHWIRHQNQKWHAWPHGGHRTLCGRVTTSTLLAGEAEHLEIRAALDPKLYAAQCAGCRRKARTTRTMNPDAAIAAWEGYIRLYLNRVRAQMPGPEDITVLATRLAEVGTPDDPTARNVWEQIQILLLMPRPIRRKDSLGRTRTTMVVAHLHEALEKVPPATGALQQVAAAFQMWRTVTGRDPSQDRFRADRVIDVMRQIPDVEPYLRHLHGRGLAHLAAVFHPNTLARAKRESVLRGTFSGAKDYWDATLNQLTIVEE